MPCNAVSPPHSTDSTSLSQPRYPFATSGLTDQLLALVVMEERHDLEEARAAIVTSTAQMKLELKQIEDRTLELLSASEGSPVDDIDLILSLEASKLKADEISAKVGWCRTRPGQGGSDPGHRRL